MSTSNLSHLLDQAEAAIGASRKLPLTTRRLVEASPLLELIDQIRLSIPEELREASRLIERREAVINQALMEAKKVIAAAEEEAKTRVQESDIAQTARREAEELLTRAHQEAETMTQQAREEMERRRLELEQYALGVLGRLEEYLAGTLSTVRRGLEALRSGAEFTLGEKERR